MRGNVLVVDDEIKIIEVVTLYLENEGYNVFSSLNGIDAIEKYKSCNPDLIILDLMLPDVSGEEICKRIRKESQVPIIMLTSKSTEEDILSGYSLGTDDYITKPFSPKQLVAKINAILKRVKIAEDTKLYFSDGLIIDPISHQVVKKGKEIDLTVSEYKLLLLLSHNPKRVFTRDEILDNITDDNSSVYDRIVDSHIKNLRIKLENDTKNPKYIKTIRGVGYKFDDK
ncbi:response regulator transcription factor [Clostridium oceanicum]|uniref:Stage 0 sporulation protein A homolog n=1 Tax=Clostridium oceanicum TaxID=1543 RepID=A0ABP3ULS5_9CLOT